MFDFQNVKDKVIGWYLRHCEIFSVFGQCQILESQVSESPNRPTP